jgi:hypothetical protein
VRVILLHLLHPYGKALPALMHFFCNQPISAETSGVACRRDFNPGPAIRLPGHSGIGSNNLVVWRPYGTSKTFRHFLGYTSEAVKKIHSAYKIKINPVNL